MVSGNDLKELLGYSAQAPVLSVYLNTDPTSSSADRYKLRLRNMLKEIDLPDDVLLVERYFDHEYDWSGRSVVLFSCAPDDFFRAFSIAVPVRSRVRVSNRPHVKPLVDLFDSYGGYGVALIDSQGARLFHFHLGGLEEQEGLVGENIRRTKQGGGSQAAGRRGGSAGLTHHTAELTERNMRESAEFAARFFAENEVRRVLIGGTEDNVAQFRNLLPKTWQSLVMGSFPISMTTSHAEVQERAMELAQASEIKREARMVDQLITAAAKDQAGVVRLEDTLGAIYEGRAQTLVLMEGFRAPGYRCKGCEYLTTQELVSCPFCGNEFDQIPDAIEMAVRRVLQAGGEVEILHENPMLENAGKIGAFLRY
jgi:rubrerythrin